MVELTAVAADKLRELRGDDASRAVVRLYVAGRTCCGYEYALAFDERTEESDTVTDCGGVPVAIDAESLPYCDGATIDYVNEALGGGFVVRNERFGGGCACGG